MIDFLYQSSKNLNKFVNGACEFGVNEPNRLVNSSNRLLTTLSITYIHIIVNNNSYPNHHISTC